MIVDIKTDYYQVTPKTDDFELEPIFDTNLDRAIQRAEFKIYCKYLARSLKPSVVMTLGGDVIYRNLAAKYQELNLSNSCWKALEVPGQPELVLLQFQEPTSSSSLTNSSMASP
ncbi:hypothetical protein [Myxosarcina sp. GI1(2024)]